MLTKNQRTVVETANRLFDQDDPCVDLNALYCHSDLSMEQVEEAVQACSDLEVNELVIVVRCPDRV